MKKYEYKSVILKQTDFVTCRELNKLGKDGWEFVSIPHYYGTPDKTLRDALCLFRREIE